MIVHNSNTWKNYRKMYGLTSVHMNKHNVFCFLFKDEKWGDKVLVET